MDYSITAKIIDALRDYIVPRGGDFSALLNTAGITAPASENSDLFIPLQPVLQLFELAAEALDDELFGIHFGQTLPGGSLGLYNFIVLNAPTVREALHACVQNVLLTVNAGEISFIETTGAGFYTWHFADGLTPRDQYVGFVVSLTIQRLRLIVQRPLEPSRIDFEFSAPKRLAEVQALLGHNLDFNTSPTRIVIGAADLDALSINADPYLYNEITSVAATRLRPSMGTPPIIETISNAILKGLPSGRASQAHIGRELAMSPRTLQRILEDKNMTYRDLLDDTRKQMGRQLLTETSLPLTEIAFMLGYSELSVFSRAAKNWFGVAPSALRYPQTKPFE
jgi:AraC-like DNA-binding protein